VAWGPVWAQAREWLRQKLSPLGLTPVPDAAGNNWITLPGESSKTVIVGGHLDSVPNGGWLDGTHGVLVALEALRRHAQLPHRTVTLRLVDWADEEGARFGRSLLGSSAAAGRLKVDEVRELRDAEGIRLEDALRDHGVSLDSMLNARQELARIDARAYLEMHIEQGPVLESLGASVGVVTAINGGNRFVVDIGGMAGHAGTVPMRLRRDALAAAAECVLATEAAAQARSDVVATVGKLEAAPGAVNVIPGHVRFTLDVRAPTDVARIEAVKSIREACEAIARRRGVTWSIEPLWEASTAACESALQRQFAAAVEGEGLPVHVLPSGAGHDGMAIISIAPIGMLFIRCKHGISHNPAEAVDVADVDDGARVLLRFIRNFVPPSGGASVMR
jgi:allantoate deiminase